MEVGGGPAEDPMTEEQIVRTWLDALSDGDRRRLEILTASDFQIKADEGPTPTDRDPYLTAVDAVIESMPDWRVEVDEVDHREDVVRTRIHVTGTQSQALDLTKLGGGWLPATGRSVDIEEEAVFRVEDGRVQAESVLDPATPGVFGILERLGADLDRSTG